MQRPRWRTFACGLLAAVECTLQVGAGAAARAKPGEWILGRGWHQEKWNQPPAAAVEGFPTHDSLSRVSAANPVLLTHASGHASFVNGKAMQEAGITRETKNPSGGEILKDGTGDPTGLPLMRALVTARVLMGAAASVIRGAPLPRLPQPLRHRVGAIALVHVFPFDARP